MTLGTAAFRQMHFVLGEIARGRPDCGRPLAAEAARQMARDVLIQWELEWPQGKHGEEQPKGKAE